MREKGVELNAYSGGIMKAKHGTAVTYHAKSLPCHTFSKTGKFPESSE